MTSRKPRTSDRGVKDFNVLIQAVKAVRIKNEKVKSVARAFEISHGSLFRYLKKFDEVVPNASEINDRQFERVLRSITGYATLKMVII